MRGRARRVKDQSLTIQHLRLRLCDFSQAVVGNGGPRLRVAITLRRFDAHFASKVQWRKISRVVQIFDLANNFHEAFVVFKSLAVASKF